MHNPFRSIFALFLIACYALPASSQIRQTALYIDNGSGGFTVLTAPGAGGSLVLPSSGTLLATTTGVIYNTLGEQNTNVTGANYLFNVAYGAGVDNASVAGAKISSVATGTNRNATGLDITATATGIGSATGINLVVAGSAFTYDITGTGGLWSVSNAGNIIAASVTGAGTGLTGTAAGLTAGNVTTNANLTGPVTSSGNATTITNGAVTYAMLQNESATSLLGNPTGGAIAPEEITLGSSLTFTGTALNTIQGITTTSTPKFGKLGLNQVAGVNELEVTGNISTNGGGSITAAGPLIVGSTFTVALVTATVASNATSLDNTHTFFIIPANAGSVAVTAPATPTGKVIFIENSSGFATSGIEVVPNGSTWQLIYDGSAWRHIQ